MDINQHIIENLNYYLKIENPEYGFLLTGDWGAGKSFFIEKFMEEYNIENTPNPYAFKRIIKISLFGMKSTSSIDEKIFQELHPILGSKYTKLFGSFLKGALKFGVKIDLDKTETIETSLNLDSSWINSLLSQKDTVNNIVIVLDDLERTSIPLKEILGYINYLTEISKVKTIIIANEKKLTNTDESFDTYNTFKEKVIGKTFEVKHDFNEVLQYFLKEFANLTLKEYPHIIKHVYLKSNYKNLRKIKQAIIDFNYLLDSLKSNHYENKEFLSILIRNYFALSIEAKEGTLIESQLRNGTPFIKNKSDISEIFKKYDFNGNNLYPGTLWADILFKGDLSNVNEITNNLVFFNKPTQKEEPTWVKLWNFNKLDEDEFNSLTSELINNFISLKEEEYPIYLHKLALLIYFSKNKLVEYGIEEIEKTAKIYLHKYKESDTWKQTSSFGETPYFNGTGYSYYNSQDENFVKIFNAFQKEKSIVLQQIKNHTEQQKGTELIDHIISDDQEKIKHVLFKNYEYEPILHNITPIDFINALCKSKNSTLNFLNQVFYERYNSHNSLNGKIAYLYMGKESEFWKKCHTLINKELPKQKKLKQHILKNMNISTIDGIIKLLEPLDHS